MTATTLLQLPDGVRIVVPDSLGLMTPYVLVEQSDWFEDEIKFVRQLLRPGERVIDIGANMGVYALSMAKAIGPQGKLWAFEPASRTAALLAQSIGVNGFGHMVLEQAALSSVPGELPLRVNDNCELNALSHDCSALGDTETVAVTTLDECREACAWQAIEFVKIDAEGEECHILRGGARFFQELSPLVQYEIRAGDAMNLELVQQFATLGYRSYRLVPGLGVLIPFDAAAARDPYLLNLFCCKEDRAEQLARRGLLVRRSLEELAVAHSQDLERTIGSEPGRLWCEREARKPYYGAFAEHWAAQPRAAGRELAERALACHAISHDSALSAELRVLALARSLEALAGGVREGASHPRLLSQARVAQEYGERNAALHTLRRLIDAISMSGEVDMSEPFLAPNRRLESLHPGTRASDWFIAGSLEQIELLSAHSSYFTSEEPARSRLRAISRTGFGSAEMSRRLALLNARFGDRPAQ
jgi:FkbM family methyltransferase